MWINCILNLNYYGIRVSGFRFSGSMKFVFFYATVTCLENWSEVEDILASLRFELFSQMMKAICLILVWIASVDFCTAIGFWPGIEWTLSSLWVVMKDINMIFKCLFAKTWLWVSTSFSYSYDRALAIKWKVELAHFNLCFFSYVTDHRGRKY